MAGNNRWWDIALIVVAVAIPVAFGFAGLWYWVGMWLTMLLALGVWEFVAWRRTDDTLTRQFRAWFWDHKPAGLGIMLALVTGMVLLVMHLAL